jgi:uncharacterized membrane protein YhiD involved in acid resistance
MFQDFQNFWNYSLNVGDVLANMGIAFACCMVIALFYRYTYRGPGYSVSFINSLVVLGMITAVVIMVIGNNLARAFGLVGAMSIIRFRTAVKETMDIVYIFFSLSIGMAAGVGLHAVAVTGTLFIGLIITALSKTNFFSLSNEKFLLQFRYTGTNGSQNAPYMPVLNNYCNQVTLLNIKSIAEHNLELSYHVSIKNKKRNSEFISELEKINGVNQINLYFDEEVF